MEDESIPEGWRSGYQNRMGIGTDSSLKGLMDPVEHVIHMAAGNIEINKVQSNNVEEPTVETNYDGKEANNIIPDGCRYKKEDFQTQMRCEMHIWWKHRALIWSANSYYYT